MPSPGACSDRHCLLGLSCRTVLAVVVQVQGPNRGVDLALKELDSLVVPYLDFSIDLGLSDSSHKGRQLANSVEQFRCSVIHSVQDNLWIWRKVKVPLCIKPGFKLFFIGDVKSIVRG